MQQGSRVRLVGTDIMGTVAAMRGEVFEVHWDRDPAGTVQPFPYSALFTTGVRNADVELFPAADLTPANASNHAFDRAMAMAHNTGAMESTLEGLFLAFESLAAVMPTDGASQAYAKLNRMQASIVRCGEMMRPIPNSNGTQSIPHLATFVIDHRP